MKVVTMISTTSLSRDAQFWQKVSADTRDGCWEWVGARFPKGYGCVTRRGTPSTPKTHTWRAHRYSWFLAHGPIPEGMVVCHRCDNPPCVNPDHLFLGTQKENQEDMVRKLRGRYGIRNGRAVLTEDDVRTIRRRYQDGETQQSLAEAFGVKGVTIQALISRRTWKHVE